MKKFAYAAAVTAALALSACGQSKEAEAVEQAGENEAAVIENQADNLMEAADNAVGNEAAALENQAENLTDKADAVEEKADEKADAINANSN